MPFFKRNPSEQELELIVMRAATLTRAHEENSRSVATRHDIARWVSFALDERHLKNDENSMKMASLGVRALLGENTFLNELMDYQLKSPHQPLPAEFRAKMIAAIKKMVDEFLAHT